MEVHERSNAESERERKEIHEHACVSKCVRSLGEWKMFKVWMPCRLYVRSARSRSRANFGFCRATQDLEARRTARTVRTTRMASMRRRRHQLPAARDAWKLAAVGGQPEEARCQRQQVSDGAHQNRTITLFLSLVIACYVSNTALKKEGIGQQPFLALTFVSHAADTPANSNQHAICRYMYSHKACFTRVNINYK